MVLNSQMSLMQFVNVKSGKYIIYFQTSTGKRKYHMKKRKNSGNLKLEHMLNL